MSHSNMVVYTLISPNKDVHRKHAIDRITPHCTAERMTAEEICACFMTPEREASCNYGIGGDGRVSLCVEEEDRSWCSSSRENDHRAITIECCSEDREPFAMNEIVYQTLIDLCVDICQRHGKTKLLGLEIKIKRLLMNRLRTKWFSVYTAGLPPKVVLENGCILGWEIWQTG